MIKNIIQNKVKSERELLIERILKLENYVIEESNIVLKKIYEDHIRYLRKELNKLDAECVR